MILYYETEDNSLMHYGVPGMKWGKRKAKYITAYQAQKNATKAAEEARKKSVAESRSSGDKGVGSFARANRKALNAKRKAYGESITKDVTHNKQLRAEIKKVKKAAKQAKKDSIARGKELDRQLKDKSQIRWNEDYNNRLIKKMTKKDWDDVKAYEHDKDVKAAVSMALTAVGGIAITALMQS